MRIKIPIGKVLAGGVAINGVIISELTSRFIKKKTDDGLKRTVAQSVAISGISSAYMAIAEKLWNSKVLNIEIGEDEEDDVDTFFMKHVEKWFRKVDHGKMDATEFHARLYNIYVHECSCITILTRAWFFSELHKRPDLEKMIYGTAVFIYLLNMADDNPKPDEKTISEFHEQYLFFLSKLRYTDNIRTMYGVSNRLWEHIIYIIVNGDLHFPDETIDTIGMIFGEVHSRRKDSPGTVYDYEDVDTLEELLEVFKKVQTTEVIKRDTTSGTEPIIHPDVDDDDVDLEEMFSNMDIEDLCDLLHKAAEDFHKRRDDPEGARYFFDTAKRINPDAYNLFSSRWPKVGGYVIDLCNRCTVSGPDFPSIGEIESERDTNVSETYKANHIFVNEMKELREIGAVKYKSLQEALHALDKIVNKAKANIYTNRDIIVSESKRVTNKLINAFDYVAFEQEILRFLTDLFTSESTREESLEELNRRIDEWLDNKNIRNLDDWRVRAQAFVNAFFNKIDYLDKCDGNIDWRVEAFVWAFGNSIDLNKEMCLIHPDEYKAMMIDFLGIISQPPVYGVSSNQFDVARSQMTEAVADAYKAIGMTDGKA